MLNVLAPVCYLGIDEQTPLGRMVDTSFNQIFATVAGVTTQNINISTSNPWFLHSIYITSPNDTVFIKPYDEDGMEIFTDFYLSNPTGWDPFPILPPRPFRPNALLRYDIQVTTAGGSVAEVIFRGYELAPAGAPGGNVAGGIYVGGNW